MTRSTDVCWDGGRVIPRSEAGPGPSDRAFRYGDGIFATLRLTSGRLLDARRQLDRLARSASWLDLDLPAPVASPAGLGRVLARLGVEKADSGVVRIQVSAAPGPRGYARGSRRAWELVELAPVPGPRSLSVAVLADGEVPPPAYPGVKSCSALAHVRCAAAAVRRGADEAVRVHGGALLEASAANLFWVAGDELRTPAASLPLYPGITRELVLEAARGLGWPVREAAFAPRELEAIDGAFLTNAVRGVEPIERLDGRSLNWSARLESLRRAAEALRHAESLEVDGLARLPLG